MCPVPRPTPRLLSLYDDRKRAADPFARLWVALLTGLHAVVNAAEEVRQARCRSLHQLIGYPWREADEDLRGLLHQANHFLGTFGAMLPVPMVKEAEAIANGEDPLDWLRQQIAEAEETLAGRRRRR